MSVSINLLKTSSKSPIALNANCIEKFYFSIILMVKHIIKGKDSLKFIQIFKDVSLSVRVENKRCKLVTLGQTFELLIYVRFFFLRISRVARFNTLFISVNWSDKGKKLKVQRAVAMQNETFPKMFLYQFWKTCMWARCMNK